MELILLIIWFVLGRISLSAVFSFTEHVARERKNAKVYKVPKYMKIGVVTLGPVVGILLVLGSILAGLLLIVLWLFDWREDSL